MSDDLVKRLRDTPNWMREGFQGWKDNVRTYDNAPFEAADRIEDLEARVEALTAELRKMERALRWIGYKSPMIDALPATMQKHARATLAELKGQDDE